MYVYPKISFWKFTYVLDTRLSKISNLALMAFAFASVLLTLTKKKFHRKVKRSCMVTATLYFLLYFSYFEHLHAARQASPFLKVVVSFTVIKYVFTATNPHSIPVLVCLTLHQNPVSRQTVEFLWHLGVKNLKVTGTFILGTMYNWDTNEIDSGW